MQPAIHRCITAYVPCLSLRKDKINFGNYERPWRPSVSIYHLSFKDHAILKYFLINLNHRLKLMPLFMADS
jgi:hypothetical protein